MEHEESKFTIYQLKEEAPRDFHFCSFSELQKEELSIDSNNYEEIYTAPFLQGMELDDIFYQFNVDIPKDFKGHSLSVSDIVVLHIAGQDSAYYVDRVGYEDVSREFLKESPTRKAEKMVISAADMRKEKEEREKRAVVDTQKQSTQRKEEKEL